MTEDEEARFERSVDDDRGAFAVAWVAARQHLSQDPRVRNVTEYGYAAWEQLTARQRYFAFEELFQKYFLHVHGEERDQRLVRDVELEHSYLQADDVHWVQDAFGDTDVSDEDAVLPGVLAGPLHRVLLELELLQFRVATTDPPTASGD
ncbi:hypothetical protein [Streptacidiphilus sp. PAMC 29251]